jgi:UDP-GlcNAc3NAcA epimerase
MFSCKPNKNKPLAGISAPIFWEGAVIPRAVIPVTLSRPNQKDEMRPKKSRYFVSGKIVMQKIVTIVGARPQFVKASALSRALLQAGIPEVLVHTGQHFDDNMADVFFREMEIPEPAYNLEIHSLPHGAMTGRMTEAIEKVLLEEKPSAVVVYGDTNSTLAGALAAAKLHIPVAHVEAGLRSFNLRMPEEINRILTDRISSWLFCPTETSVANLRNEGFDHFPAHIHLTGDVMYDVALHYSRLSGEKSGLMKRLGLHGRPFALVTLHRQENTDDLLRLSDIIGALNDLSHTMEIVLPLHPRTQKVLAAHGMQLHFIPVDPVGYFDMVELLKHCTFVMSDSGGVQKEAFFFRKHCLVLRDETEWTELTELGYNFLVGADREKIVAQAYQVKGLHRSFAETPYGDGTAALKIAEIIKNFT